MLVVLHRDVNHRFWSHLSIHDKMPLFLVIKVSFSVSLEEILRKKRSHVCFKQVSFRGQSLSHTHIGPKLRGQIFRQALPTSSQGSLPARSEVKDPTEVFKVECCLCSKYSVNES